MFGPHPQPCQPHLQASTFALLAGNLKNTPYDTPVLSFKTLIFLLLCPAVLTAQNEPKITVERAPSNVFKLQKNTTYPWKKNITATVFWVGEKPTAKNPTPNNKSSWDQNWQKNFGGFDNPNSRNGYLPKGFTPGQNPFYIALPYNDCLNHRSHRPEASRVIPWWNRVPHPAGKTVCKGRWVQLYCAKTKKICYAQWEDCGPFTTDDYNYVFGSSRPKNTKNQGAGIDISPATRDYLGVGNKAIVHWRFIEFSQIPRGPWALHGTNNPFVNPKVDVDLAERTRYMDYLYKKRQEAQNKRR